MNFKIINVGGYDAQVCVRRHRSSDGDELVYITAFIEHNAQEYVFESEIDLLTPEFAQRFVRDFSDASALEWLEHECSQNDIPRP